MARALTALEGYWRACAAHPTFKVSTRSAHFARRKVYPKAPRVSQITCSLQVAFQVAHVDSLLSVYVVLPVPLFTENGSLFVMAPMKSYLLVIKSVLERILRPF